MADSIALLSLLIALELVLRVVSGLHISQFQFLLETGAAPEMNIAEVEPPFLEVQPQHNADLSRSESVGGRI